MVKRAIVFMGFAVGVCLLGYLILSLFFKYDFKPITNFIDNHGTPITGNEKEILKEWKDLEERAKNGG